MQKFGRHIWLFKLLLLFIYFLCIEYQLNRLLKWWHFCMILINIIVEVPF